MSATQAPALMTLCRVDDLPEGMARNFRVGRLHLAVYRNRNGKVFAVDGSCPHRGGPLADGMLVGDQIVCPLHANRFHGETGECDRADVCSVNAYPVSVEGDTVRVGLPLI